MELKDYFDDLGKKFISEEDKFRKLIKDSKIYTEKEKAQIYKALDKAIKLHANQKRKSGIPYVTHPISVASLLVNNEQNATIIIAALLHDTFEDTEYTFEQCRKEFGLPVALLVESVSKIGKNGNYETRNKILLATEKDFSTGIIKTGDRLHNEYTLDALPEYKQIRISEETEEFYVPLTDILFMNIIKKYYEDICLFFLNNPSFCSIYELRQCYKDANKTVIDNFLNIINDALVKAGIKANLDYEIKNVGAIEKELESNKLLTLDDVKDMIKVEVKLDDKESCYAASNIINNLFIGSITNQANHVLTPKENGYEAINKNVTFMNKEFAIEILTNDMYKCNNNGIFYSDNDKYKEYAKVKLKEFRESLKKEEE